MNALENEQLESEVKYHRHWVNEDRRIDVREAKKSIEQKKVHQKDSRHSRARVTWARGKNANISQRKRKAFPRVFFFLLLADLNNDSDQKHTYTGFVIAFELIHT